MSPLQRAVHAGQLCHAQSQMVMEALLSPAPKAATLP